MELEFDCLHDPLPALPDGEATHQFSLSSLVAWPMLYRIRRTFSIAGDRTQLPSVNSTYVRERLHEGS